MGRFLFGFFVAALIFVPGRTVDFIAAIGANLDGVVQNVIAVGEDAAERTRQEILRKEAERNKLEE